MGPGSSAPFVGRTTQLAVADAAAQSAAAGHPAVIWVEGVPGSGKTTLVRHVLAGLSEEFVTVQVRSDELAKGVAYELVGQLGVTESQSPFAAAQQLLDRWAHLQEQGPVAVLVDVQPTGAHVLAERGQRGLPFGVPDPEFGRRYVGHIPILRAGGAVRP